MATLTTLLVDGNGTSPRAWTSQASTDIDEGIGSADGSYAYHTPAKDTSVDTSFTLTDVDTDLGNVETLTYTVRTQQSGRADDTLHLDGRIVNGGTILAAADSGGTFQRLDADIQHTAWSNTGPTAWSYVNTTADKATWNGATLELRAVNVGLKGGDLAEIRVDTIDIDGTYTAAAAATDIAGTLTTSSTLAGTPTTIAPGTTAAALTLTASSALAGTPTTAAAPTDIAGTVTASSTLAGTATTIAPGTTAIAGTLTTSSSVAGTPTTTGGTGPAEDPAFFWGDWHLRTWTEDDPIGNQTDITLIEGGTNANDLAFEIGDHADVLGSHMVKAHVDCTGSMTYWQAAIYDADVAFNVVVDIVMSPDWRASNSTGVIFRNSSATTFTDCYYLTMDQAGTDGTGGTMTLWERSSSSDTSLGTWRYKETGSSTNDCFYVRIEANGSAIDVLVDEGSGSGGKSGTYTNRISVTDSTHSSGTYVGQIGQRANAQSNGEPVFGSVRAWTYGTAPVVAYYETPNGFAETASAQTIGFDSLMFWLEGDVIVTAQAIDDAANGTLNLPTQANLAFVNQATLDGDATGEAAIRIDLDTAPSTIYDTDIGTGKTGTATPWGGAVWVVTGVDDTTTPTTTSRTEATLAPTDPDAGSTVLQILADVNGTSGHTGTANSGTLTERYDAANDGLGVWLADWVGVDNASFAGGPTSYAGTKITQGLIVLAPDTTPTAGPAVTDIVGAVTASSTLAGTLTAYAALTAAIDASAGLAGTATTIDPGTTAAALTLDASSTLAGTATAPTPTPTAAALTIDASSSVAGTPTAPTTGTTDIAGTLTADVTLAGTATTLDPGTTAAALTLTASSSIVGVPTAPSAGGPTILFSEDFSDISAGADIDEDSNWVIHSRGNATAKEANGWGRLYVPTDFPSTITIEPVYTAQDEKCELVFTYDTTGTAPTVGNYDRLIIAARADHFDTTATPSSPWDADYPYRGWYYIFWPERDSNLYLYRANSGIAGTLLQTASPPPLPSGSTANPWTARLQWEKTSTSPDYWTHRARFWDSTGSEPSTWDIEYEDQSPGVHDDAATGKWIISQSHHLGIAAAQQTDLDDIEINDMTPTNQTLLVGNLTAGADVAGTLAAPATFVTLALDASADVSGTPSAPTADSTPIVGILDASSTLAGTATTVDPGTTAAALTLTADTPIAGQPVGTVYIVPDPSASERLAVDYDSGYGTTADRTPVYSTTSDPVYPTMNAAIWEPTGDPVGVILYLVGGGFISNAYQTGVPHWIKRQVGRGFVVCSLQYRTSFVLNPNRRPWDDGIENIQDGPGFAATEWPGVPQLVAGHSAGAFYALHLSASADIPVISMAGWSDWDHWNWIRANPTLAGDPQPFNPVWMDTSHTTLFEDPPWTDNEEPAAAWPQFTATAPDAAYIIAGDNDGVVHPNLAWSAATMLGAVNIATHVDFIDNVSGTNIDDHEPIAGFNYPALDQWLADQGFAGKAEADGQLTADAGLAGTPTAPAPAATELVAALDASSTVAGTPTAPLNETDIVGALDVAATLAGTPTTVDPGTTAAALTLTASATLAGTPTTVDPGTTDLTAAIDAAVTLAGTPTTTGDFDPITAIDWDHAHWAEGTEFVAEGFTDGGIVDVWPDEISTRDPGQASGTRPIYRDALAAFNSQPAVEFASDTDVFRKLTTFTVINPTWSIVVIAHNIDVSSGDQRPWAPGGAASDDRVILENSDGTMKIRTDAGFQSTSNSVTEGEPFLFSGVFDSTTSVAYLDGVETTFGASAWPVDANDWQVGGRSTVGKWRGAIAFIGVKAGSVLDHPNWPGFEEWTASHYAITLEATTDLTAAIDAAATLAGTATTIDPGVTEAVADLTVEATLAGTPTTTATGVTDLTAALDASSSLAGTATTIDPGTTELDAAIDASATVEGTPAAPTADSTPIVGTLDASAGLEGTPTAPAPAATELDATITADATVAGAPTTAGATELTAAITASSTLAGTPTTADPGTTAIAGTIDTDATLVGVPAAPSADATPIVGIVTSGADVAGTSTAPAPTPTELDADLTVDLSALGTFTVTTPGVTDIAGALDLDATVQWLILPPQTWLPVEEAGPNNPLWLSADRTSILIGTKL